MTRAKDLSVDDPLSVEAVHNNYSHISKVLRDLDA